VSLRSRIRRLLRLSQPAPDPDEVVPVALPEGEEVGALWRGMLEQQGIPAMLRDVSPLYRGYMNWAAECELCVRRRDIERARAILGVNAAGVLPSENTRRSRRHRA